MIFWILLVMLMAGCPSWLIFGIVGIVGIVALVEGLHYFDPFDWTDESCDCHCACCCECEFVMSCDDECDCHDDECCVLCEDE